MCGENGFAVSARSFGPTRLSPGAWLGYHAGMESNLVISGVISFVLLAGSAAVFVRQRRARARALYEHHLEDALADGVLTEEEAEELASIREDRALADAEVRMVALAIYRRALNEAASDSRITLEEDANLERLQQQLSLTERDLAEDRQQVQRVRLLARIERGLLPRVEPPVSLDEGEVCYWALRARVAQRLHLPGTATAPARFLRFRVDGAAPFFVSGARDPLAPREDVLPLDSGMLMITSRRLLFRGARKTITMSHIRLAQIDLYTDGIRNEEDEGAAQLYLVDDAELTAAILLAAARHRLGELRGTAPGRTA